MEQGAAWITIYQPLIVGLGAVVLGLMGNTALEWLKINWSQKRAAQAIRSVILQELLVAERTAEGGLERTSDWDPADGLFFPVIERYPAFDHHLKDLGLLHPEETRAIVEAYSYLNSIPEWLVHVATFVRSEGRLFGRVQHDDTTATVMVALQKNVLEKVQAATWALKKRMPSEF